MRKLVLLASLFLAIVPEGSARAAVTGLGRSGRTYTYNGNGDVYFVGVDAQSLVANAANNLTALLDQLRAVRINKVRVWLDAYWDPNGRLHPWVRSGGKYNLDLTSNFSSCMYPRSEAVTMP